MEEKEKPGEVMQRLKGEKLAVFFVDEWTEVYNVDEDGKRVASVGLLRSAVVAQAFAELQPNGSAHRTQKRTVLTDGEVAFVIGEQLKIINESKAASEVREAALKKLSGWEKEILGLK